ncbi:MAG: hypothetical protein Q9Q40_08155 [Acidobacteriota bacterium]|nr:hypothetical protein [Acidobacteriota bacterium]
MNTPAGQSAPVPFPEPLDDGPVDHERLAAALERGLRQRLSREFAPGPACSRLAHLEAQRQILAACCERLEQEIVHLRDADLPEEATRLEHGLQQARDTRTKLLEQCRKLEAELAGAKDPPRFAALRETVEKASTPETIRARANECLQAIGRIGVPGIRFLWRELATVAERGGHPLTADLVRRFEEAVAAAEIHHQRIETLRRSRQSEPTIALLREQARALLKQAPQMSLEELRDHLTSIAGRLKAIQEEATPVGRQADLLKQTFGILTRISKDYQPGWTPLLDPKRKGEDWRAYARQADLRIEARRAAQRAAQQAAEQEQKREALERLREFERQIVLDESLERLRTAIYHLDGLPRVAGTETIAAEFLAEARLQAEIALRAAGGPEDIERLNRVLGERREEICSGRVFRPLRRSWSEPAPAASLDTLDAAENPEVQVVVESLARPWPPEIEACRNAGKHERVLLVGGRPSPRREKLFQEFFGWSTVEWQESYRDHQADYATLRRRIAADRFDRVIVLGRYCGHDVSTSLSGSCRTHGVSYHVHPGGLSVASLATFIYGA